MNDNRNNIHENPNEILNNHNSASADTTKSVTKNSASDPSATPPSPSTHNPSGLISLLKIVDWIQKHILATLLVTILSALIIFSARKYLGMRIPANNLRFSEVSDIYISQNVGITNDDGDFIRFCTNWSSISFTVENIDEHEAIIQDISIEITDFEAFNLQNDVYPLGTGSDVQHVMYIASLENETSHAYMYDEFGEEHFDNNFEFDIDKCLDYAKIYSSSHYEKLSQNETDYVRIQLVNFPDDGYYTVDINITYTIGTDVRQKTLSNISIQAITEDSFKKHEKSLY